MNPKTQKYVLIVSYLALCLVNFFYFYPLQENFYLDSDIKSIETNSYIILLQIFLIGLGLIIVIFHDSITFLSNTTKTLLLLLVLFFGFSQKSLMSLILFSNRLSEKEIISKKYIVGKIAGSPLSKENFHLLDLESNKITSEDKLLTLVYSDKLKPQDTIVVLLKFGLWKIKFLETK